MNAEQLILLIDLQNYLGELLIQKMREESSVYTFVFIEKKLRIPDAFYAHLIVVFSEKKELFDILPDIFKKAQNEDVFAWVIVNHRSEYKGKIIGLAKKYSQARVIVTGDIFGEGVPFDDSIPIHRFFQESSTTGRISVQGMGMQKTYPIHITDTIGAIVSILRKEEKKKIIYLYPKNVPTQLSLAGIFHKINPDLLIDFIEESDQVQEDTEEWGEHFFADSYPLLETIKKNQKKHPEFKKEFLRKADQNHRHIYTKKSLLLLLVIIFIFPIVVTITSLLLGIGMIAGVRYQLEQGSIGNAKRSLLIGKSLLGVSQNTSSVVYAQAAVFGQRQTVGRLQDDMVTAQTFFDGLEYVVLGLEKFQVALSGKSSDAQGDFKNGIYQTKQALIAYQKLQAEYASKKNASILFGNNARVDRVLELVDGLKTIEALFGNTADFLPELIGIPKKRKYLVLFQNNMELRPGGGFIGSYGLLVLDKGKIEEFSIHDVYDADGKLKAHIEPPYPIRRYVPSIHWFLRDSNFDIDFPRGASASAFFLHLETGEQIDGVIAVDTTFVKNIPSATGSVFVPDYKETVTRDNFYELTQKHVQENFFPGSTQKKDFLRSLFDALQKETFVNRNISYVQLVQVLNDSIREKHVLFAFSNAHIQKLFEVSGASSTLAKEYVEEEGTLRDFFGLSEANIGVNKANYFIKRRVSQNITIHPEGNVTSQISLMYKNTSTKEKGEDYKVYIQLALPSGTDIHSVAIDGKEQHIIPAVTDPLVYESKDFKKPEGLELDTYEQSGKTIVGFLTTVMHGQLQTINITTQLPSIVSIGDPQLRYSYSLFKQPGTEEYPFYFSLTFPKNLRVFYASPILVEKQEKIEADITFAQDESFEIRFSSK